VGHSRHPWQAHFVSQSFCPLTRCCGTRCVPAASREWRQLRHQEPLTRLQVGAFDPLQLAVCPQPAARGQGAHHANVVLAFGAVPPTTSHDQGLPARVCGGSQPVNGRHALQPGRRRGALAQHSTAQHSTAQRSCSRGEFYNRLLTRWGHSLPGKRTQVSFCGAIEMSGFLELR
jgi:hypothetical protein